MSKRKTLTLIIVIASVLVISSVTIFTTRQSVDTPDRLLTLGEKYLTDLNYEQALVQFLKVIEIDPKNPRGYTGAAEAYIGLDRTEDAIAILRQGLDRTSDEGIRTMLDELTANMPVELSDTTEKPSDIQDVSASILSAEQLLFLEPLETAILALDYENAFKIQSSMEFSEIYKTIPGWEEGVFRASDEVVYKTDGEREWYIQNNTVGPNGVNYGPRIGVWINGRENGTHIHSFLPLQSTPAHVLMISADYSGGLANGSYKRVYFDENSDFMIESGTASDGVKHGEEIIETDFVIVSPYLLVDSSAGGADTTLWVSVYDYGKYITFTNPDTGNFHLYLDAMTFEDGTVGYPVLVDLETRGQDGAGYIRSEYMDVINEIK